MSQTLQAGPHATPVTGKVTAIDVMTPNSASLRETSTVWEAVTFLTTKGFSAAPVINAAGRPVGVLSRSDLIVHDRQVARYLHRPQQVRPDVIAGPIDTKKDPTPIREVMTPFVLQVSPDTPVASVARQMADYKVHRLFVVDDRGVMVGVISALDMMRHYGHVDLTAATPVVPKTLE